MCSEVFLEAVPHNQPSRQGSMESWSDFLAKKHFSQQSPILLTLWSSEPRPTPSIGEGIPFQLPAALPGRPQLPRANRQKLFMVAPRAIGASGLTYLGQRNNSRGLHQRDPGNPWAVNHVPSCQDKRGHGCRGAPPAQTRGRCTPGVSAPAKPEDGGAR